MGKKHIKPSVVWAQVAQSVEQGTENPRVGSSILSLGTTTATRLSEIFQRAFCIWSFYTGTVHGCIYDIFLIDLYYG